ncbi:MAG: hypothetical protein IT195_04165 [Microthrixaceae bacterium]|nr:hypothetical protein [Microthrixaceae bacterium]
MSGRSGPGDIAAARAADQEAARRRREIQQALIRERFGHEVPGRPLVALNLVLTAAMVVTSALGVFDYDRFAFHAALVDLAIFAVGLTLFVVALWLGAQRSREAEMDVAAWFFLARVAPDAIRRPMLLALTLQTVVSLGAAFMTMAEATAAGDQATKMAFGTLVPIFGLAVNGVWSARYGAFPPRSSGVSAGGPGSR